jgi:hypothetical protein
MSRGQVVYTLHLWPPLGHAGHYTGSAIERRLGQRLTDHALGRGARLTQAQVERGGSWVLAQTQPGDRTTERRLKQHGATRRCEVCRAVDGYRAGELTAEAALARAGWDRSNEVQRSILLEIFGLHKPPEATSGHTREAAPAQPPDASRQEPQLSPEPDPEIDAVVGALIKSWRSPKAEVQPQPGADARIQPELEAAL